MIAFEVWIRPLGDYCRVKVDGIENARWLLQQLSQSFIFQTFDGINQRYGSPQCIFKIPYNPPLSHLKFEKILRAMPEITLMSEPD